MAAATLINGYICFMNYLELYKSAIQELKPELERKFAVRSIGLFGSLVRKDFSSTKSDLDIIVDFSSPVGVEFIDLANFLESRLNRKVDLVSRNGIRPQYFHQIESEIVYV
jgi:predicted nucleotidyltransferase